MCSGVLSIPGLLLGAVKDPLDAFDRGIEWVSGELLCVASREMRSVSNLEHDDNRTPETQTGNRS